MEQEHEEQDGAPIVKEEKTEVPFQTYEPKARKGIVAALCLFFSNVSIEPMLFVRSVADYVSLVIQQKLKLERFCTVGLNYTEEECSLMDDSNHTDIQVAAQVLDIDFSFYETLIGNIIPLLILLFLGSWSDKHGRKIPLCLSLLGYVLFIGVYLLEAIFPQWPAQVLMVAVLLKSSGGGYVTFLMAMYSFMSDRTSTRSRTSRMAIMNAIWHLGEPVGTLVGAWLYNETGYIGTFSTALALYVWCLLYVIIILQDQIPKDENLEEEEENDRRSRKCSCKSTCDPQHVVGVARAAFRSRPDRGRPHLIIVMTLMLLEISGSPHNKYLWCRRVLGWDENQYSLWYSIDAFYQQVVLLCVSPFLVMVHDCVAGAVQGSFFLAHDLWLASVTRPDQWWVVYASSALGMTQPVISVVIRSSMSKICDQDELGKVFSLLAIMETIYPLLDKVIYVAVYDATIDTYPSAEHLVSACFYAVMVASFVGLWLSMRAVERKKARTSE